MTFHSISPTNYIVVYKLYRDCSGIAAPDSIQITIADSCGSQVRTAYFPKIAGSGTNVPPQCTSDTPNVCNGGLTVGVQEWIYSDTITLPGACRYYVSHAESSRSTSLTTLLSNNADLFVYCMINTSVSSNHSPDFTIEPLLYTCVGHITAIYCDPFDTEGDSMVMQLITPLINSGTPVTYRGGYSSTQPLISSPPMTITANSGVITINPQQQDVSCYAIQINEYRAGVLISQVERDLTLESRICNVKPAFLGFNGSGATLVTVTPGVQTCFTIPSSDADANSHTVITLTNAFAGMSFTHTGGTIDSANICYTPVAGDTAANPHCFNLKVQDDGCPFSEFKIQSFCINVDGVNQVGEIGNEPISIFPNPVESILNFDLKNTGERIIRIFDVQGRQVLSKKTEGMNSINVSELEAGLYLLEIVDKESDLIRPITFIKK